MYDTHSWGSPVGCHSSGIPADSYSYHLHRQHSSHTDGQLCSCLCLGIVGQKVGCQYVFNMNMKHKDIKGLAKYLSN